MAEEWLKVSGPGPGEFSREAMGFVGVDGSLVVRHFLLLLVAGLGVMIGMVGVLSWWLQTEITVSGDGFIEPRPEEGRVKCRWQARLWVAESDLARVAPGQRVRLRSRDPLLAGDQRWDGWVEEVACQPLSAGYRVMVGVAGPSLWEEGREEGLSHIPGVQARIVVGREPVAGWLWRRGKEWLG